MRGHFRSRDKDGGQSHQSIRHNRKPNDTRESDGSIFYRTGVMGDRSLGLHYDLYLNPMTFL